MEEAHISRHARAKELFLAALELDEEERRLMLDAACDDEPELRQEVEALLAADSRARAFLHKLHDGEKSPGPFASDPWISTKAHFGPYRVVEKIGEGGTSVVYLGVRDDQEYQKRVAIKFLRTGLATEEAQKRLRAERQILAALEHPNIARLLDGGTTDQGVPYLVMEYIEGLGIDRYCELHRLSTAERLELFRHVCSAVAYAHRNLVVHRDLKPGNILVTDEGVPKLLDFGIAKLLNPELSAQGVDPTRLDARMMTPAYASPEQIKGVKITTSSDIYSLGVLLFRLLTGRPPYSLEHASLAEITRVVCSVEPPRPSRVVLEERGGQSSDSVAAEADPQAIRHLARLEQSLKGDLDHIILKTLRKEPERRYESVEKLWDDIERHLEGLPVTARKGTFTYRWGKFLRRNRVSVGFALVLTAVLVAFVSSVLVQSARIARAFETAQAQREIAERQEAKARAINQFLQETLGAPNPEQGPGHSVTVLEALRSAAAKIEDELAGQEDVQAAVRYTIGTTLMNLGRYDDARPLLESALGTRRDLHGQEHSDVAESLHRLAELYRAQGDFEASERCLREALDVHTRLFDRDSEQVAQTMFQLAWTLLEKGELERAEEMSRSALEIMTKVLGESHPEVIRASSSRAVLLRRKGDLEGAERIYRQLLGILEERPDGVRRASILNNLAVVLREKGEYQEAEIHLREALELAESLWGEEHPYTAASMISLGAVMLGQGKLDEAENWLRGGLPMFRSAIGDEHPEVAKSLVFLAELLRQKGSCEEAEPLLEEAISINENAFGPEDWRVAEAESDYGACLVQLGRASEAESMLEGALLTLERELGMEDPRTREAASRLERIRERSS